MIIYKFGGASVRDSKSVINVGSIIQKALAENNRLGIVISAMGKTTNALEKVVEFFYSGNNDEALRLYDDIKNNHVQIIQELNLKQDIIEDINVEAVWLLNDKPVRSYDYYYDQIVCIGELLSTTIVTAYCNQILKLNIDWIDARDIIRTDNIYRDAAIDMAITEQKISEIKLGDKIFITQGFIGATDENQSTTLGREGSDYTAAALSNLLNAKNLTIWKDVTAVMNADPKTRTDTVELNHLSYEEITEMAYYGAQVIHPKTFQPLYEKKIPLYVKSFINPNAQGTLIDSSNVKNLPPIFIEKTNQIVIQFSTKDLSFIGQNNVSFILNHMRELNLYPNLTHMGATSYSCCLDDRGDRVIELINKCSEKFEITVARNAQLHTIRHYLPENLKAYENKNYFLMQKTQKVFQILF